MLSRAYRTQSAHYSERTAVRTALPCTATTQHIGICSTSTRRRSRRYAARRADRATRTCGLSYPIAFCFGEPFECEDYSACDYCCACGVYSMCSAGRCCCATGWFMPSTALLAAWYRRPILFSPWLPRYLRLRHAVRQRYSHRWIWKPCSVHSTRVRP